MPAGVAEPGTAGCQSAEGRNIRTTRQLDHNRIVAARIGIIACERSPQPSGLDTDDRVGLRIEFAAAAERLDGDRVGLDPGALAGKRRLDNEGEKPGQAERAAKRRAANDAHELQADPVVGRLAARHLGPRANSPTPRRYIHARYPQCPKAFCYV